jgi:integrase
MGCLNPEAFSKLHLPKPRDTDDDRRPLPIDTIQAVQQLCYSLDDEARWLIALISDSGLRLSEAAGLGVKASSETAKRKRKDLAPLTQA